MRIQTNEIVDRKKIVTDHLRCLTEIAEISRNIENERVVVIDNDDQDGPDPTTLNASNIRCALAKVSAYSPSGSDIAVIPLPA